MLNQQQIENRQTGIGASESAALFNESPYLTAYQLYMIKTKQLEPEDISKKDYIIWGNLIEEAVAQRYAQVTGEKCRKSNITFRHKQFPHIFCHPDRLIEGKSKLLEVKCTGSWNKGFGADGSDDIPTHIIFQVQHQMLVKGGDLTDVAVFSGIHDPLKIYPIPRDDELIGYITERCNKFWLDNVVKKNAPPLSNRQDVLIAHPRNIKGMRQVNDETFKIFEKYKDIKAQIKSLEFEESDLMQKLTLEILDADGIAYKEQNLITFKADKNGVRRLRTIG